MTKTAGLLLLSFFWGNPAVRSLETVQSIHVENARLVLPPGGKGSGAIYFTLVNKEKKADRLMEAQVSGARHTMLHETVVSGDVAKMVHADHWSLPEKGRLELKPGGRHIMAMGLSSKIKPGALVDVVLRFERLGKVRIQVPARLFSD